MAYDGGKGQDGVYQRIINQMPPHDVYVEPFLGGGAIMRHKRPARVNIGIDLDSAAIAAFGGARESGIFSLRCEDGILFLERMSLRGSELIYCDPPYLIETRRQHRRIYRCELEYSDHERLLLLLRKMNCNVMISGYWSQLYADLLNGWRSISFQTVVRSGALATEWLWMNYSEPLELHDYRYLGENFRERERIRKKVKRWQAKLQNMPRLERLAISAALAVIGDGEKEKGNAELSPLKASTDIISDLAEFGDTGPGLHRRN